MSRPKKDPVEDLIDRYLALNEQDRLAFLRHQRMIDKHWTSGVAQKVDHHAPIVRRKKPAGQQSDGTLVADRG